MTACNEPDAQAVRRRDPEAFRALYQTHERDLLVFFVRRTQDPEAAADLLAETFAQALRSARRFDSNRGSTGAWLFGIAGRLVADHHRRGVPQRARRALGLLDLTPTAEQVDAIAALEADIAADLLLERLPPDQAKAVRARVLHDRSYADIADADATSEEAVRQRVSRGLAAIRQHLNAQERQG